MVFVIVALGVAFFGFIALGLWSWRSERSIDYTPSHVADERLRNTARAATTATIGFITGSA